MERKLPVNRFVGIIPWDPDRSGQVGEDGEWTRSVEEDGLPAKAEPHFSRGRERRRTRRPFKFNATFASPTREQKGLREKGVAATRDSRFVRPAESVP